VIFNGIYGMIGIFCIYQGEKMGRFGAILMVLEGFNFFFEKMEKIIYEKTGFLRGWLGFSSVSGAIAGVFGTF
jgi:hypothetical protein